MLPGAEAFVEWLRLDRRRIGGQDPGQSDMEDQVTGEQADQEAGAGRGAALAEQNADDDAVHEEKEAERGLHGSIIRHLAAAGARQDLPSDLDRRAR